MVPFKFCKSEERKVKHKYVRVSIRSGTMSLISVQKIGFRMVSTEFWVFL